MDHIALLVFVYFGFGLTLCYNFRLREYYYVNLKMSWTKAQHYCRVKYTDLATIESMDDISRLNRPNTENSLVWIGLWDDPQSWLEVMGNDVNSWRWSASGAINTAGYYKWGSNSPNNYDGKQACVFVDSSGQWNDYDCLHETGFVCYTAANPTGQITYTGIDNKVTWQDARSYCRRHHTDLAIIENAMEQTQIMSVKPTGSVWIGLYRVPWKWSDKSNSSFANWHHNQPDNYYQSQYCASEDSNHLWHDANCNTRLPFLCHALTVKMTMVRMKIQTSSDLKDPTTNAQIIQQLGVVLNKNMLTEYHLRWRIQPRKQGEIQDEVNG